MSRLEEVEDAVGRALEAGQRAYWVCPLVEESEKIDVAAAQARFEELRAKFGARVDLVHGRMKGAEKDTAMERFASGKTQLLVATTVIEVGVDVPEATIMVIEHAERFGLAQLHQLRGRVGRGTGHSTCLLIYKAPPGFHVARIETHGKYLGAARDDAALVLNRDPGLASERGQALRHLLYLFGKDEAIKMIRAG
jgi:ATP-dependent DNA helicase RecG